MVSQWVLQLCGFCGNWWSKLNVNWSDKFLKSTQNPKIYARKSILNLSYLSRGLLGFDMFFVMLHGLSYTILVWFLMFTTVLFIHPGLNIWASNRPSTNKSKKKLPQCNQLNNSIFSTVGFIVVLPANTLLVVNVYYSNYIPEKNYSSIEADINFSTGAYD